MNALTRTITFHLAAVAVAVTVAVAAAPASADSAGISAVPEHDCADGYLCLYEHANFEGEVNRIPAPTRRVNVIALNGFRDRISSYVNLTSRRFEARNWTFGGFGFDRVAIISPFRQNTLLSAAANDKIDQLEITPR